MCKKGAYILVFEQNFTGSYLQVQKIMSLLVILFTSISAGF